MRNPINEDLSHHVILNDDPACIRTDDGFSEDDDGDDLALVLMVGEVEIEPIFDISIGNQNVASAITSEQVHGGVIVVDLRDCVRVGEGEQTVLVEGI